MAGIKVNGKFEHQVELTEAIGQFYHFWMPHCTPENWPSAWEDFKNGLLDTGWITNWQFKHWHYPNL